MSRSCFCDCYGERVRQLLAKFFLFFFLLFSFLFFFFKSKLTVPEVNSTQFPVANCFLSSAKETSKFTQQEGTKKRTAKTLVYDKRDRPITCEFCRDLHLPLICSRLLQKGLFKER